MRGARLLGTLLFAIKIRSAPIFPDSQTPLLTNLQTPGFDHIVAFGDSLTDDGQGAWVLSNQTWPIEDYYYQHSFSNGPVYVKRLAELMQVPLVDHAIGGATTSNKLVQGYTGPNSSIPVDSVLQQVSSYLSSPDALAALTTKKVLFVVNGGGNNAIFGTVLAEDTVKGLIAATDLLKAAGAKYFLLPTMLARLEWSKFTADVYTELYKQTKGDKTVAIPDFYRLFTNILNAPERYGFDSQYKNDHCVKGIYLPLPGGGVTECVNPRDYIWWDEYHPTDRAHDLMARTAMASLINEGWL